MTEAGDPERAVASLGASFEPLYDVSEAAPGYSNVTGLVSTFAFAAVVLVFLIAATAAKTPTPPQNVDMGFATILFSLGFLGCLVSAFAFASLGGAPNSRALVTNSMLVASVVALCLVAVLGGFEALARAFLPSAAAAFAIICAAATVLSPILVWFPLYDVAVGFNDDGSARDPRPAAPRTPVREPQSLRQRISAKWQEQPDAGRAVIKQLAGLTLVGLLAAVGGLALHFLHVFGHPRQAEYYALGFWGLIYTGVMIVGALLLATDPRNQLPPWCIGAINAVQCLFMVALIAVLP
jgi:hypothetical protein